MLTVQQQNVRIIGISCRLLKSIRLHLQYRIGTMCRGTTSRTVRRLNGTVKLVDRGHFVPRDQGE